MVDDRDPAAHWAMGRALWLRGSQDQSIVELEQAVELSPNFALGHYTLAFVHSQGGDPQAAIASSDYSRAPQPVRSAAVRHARRARHGAGAPQAVRRGRRLGRQGRRAPERARAYPGDRGLLVWRWPGGWTKGAAHLASIRKTLPRYRVEDFLTAMQFAPEDAKLFRQGAKQIGE